MIRLVLAMGLVGLAPAFAHAQAPATFDYRTERTVTGTDGTYDGWDDVLRSSGHYEVATSGSTRAVHAVYDWRYTSPERPDSGHEDRRVVVDTTTRTYAQRATDLDDYDEQNGAQLEAWFWVPPTLAQGQTVRILGDSFDVLAPEPVTIAGAARTAIHVHREGDGARNDDYGDFATHETDEYWFDAQIGMFLRELHIERDSNHEAVFHVREEAFVVDASYAPHVGPIPADPMAAMNMRGPAALAPSSVHELPPWAIATMVGVVFLAGFLLFRRVFRNSRAIIVRGREVIAEKLHADMPVPTEAGSTTNWFGPFVPHFVGIARATGDTVCTASVGGAFAGIAIDDQSTRIATIFAREPDVCEVLRKSLGRDDFFSEMRHGNLETVIEATQKTGKSLPAGAAYNVLETYEVLRLEKPGEPSFDTQVVTRLEESEIVSAANVMNTTLGEGCERYLRASLAMGDIAYVARDGGAIVGVGLATVVGNEGRLHSLAVREGHRNRGLGRELVRARIRAMSALGVTRILTEVSTRNAASLELVRGEGFTMIGHLYVETARASAPVSTTATVRR